MEQLQLEMSGSWSDIIMSQQFAMCSWALDFASLLVLIIVTIYRLSS